MSLSKKMGNIIFDSMENDANAIEIRDAILTLPELVEMQRKAELWDRVKEIAEADCYDGCPIYDRCYSHECDLAYIVDLLEIDS